MSSTIEIASATLADQEEWDNFVLSHSGSSPYHLFAWGLAVMEAYGHRFYYLMARQNGKLVGILPLVHLKLSILINELVALPFCDVGNCVSVNSDVERKLLEAALRCSNKLKTKYIQLRGQFLGEINSYTSFTQLKAKKVQMVLHLPDSSESLLRLFSSKLRSQVRKAEKNGITFRWAGEEEVSLFYSVLSCNMRILGSPVHSKKLFEAIMQQYGEKARIGLAEYEGKCIGTGLILSTNEQTSIPWASTLRDYNHLAPNMLLYWNFLKFSTDSGKKIFDFGRSTKGEGTFRFKKQWGAEPAPLPWYSSRSSVSQQLSTDRLKQSSHRERAVKIWKKIPLPISNCVGPILRKYINL